jgi:hypothetical protein
MSEQENTQVVQQFYAADGRGVLATPDDEVERQSPGLQLKSYGPRPDGVGSKSWIGLSGDKKSQRSSN